MEENIITLTGKYKVKSIQKKTRAQFFKELKQGDVIKLSFEIENTWKYTPAVCIENERIGKKYESPNRMANYLANFEFEEYE